MMDAIPGESGNTHGPLGYVYFELMASQLHFDTALFHLSLMVQLHLL